MNYSHAINTTNVKSIVSNIGNHSIIKSFCSASAIAFHWTFGGELTPLIVMGALIGIDSITGVWKAALKNKICSKGFFRVIVKCAVYLLLMVACRIADRVMPFPFAFTAITVFLAMTELLSILENVSIIGFPIPRGLVKRLRVIQEGE